MDRDVCGPLYELRDGACQGPFFRSGVDCLRNENVFFTFTDCRSAAAGENQDYSPLDDAVLPFIEEYSRLDPRAHQHHPTNHCVTLVETLRGWRENVDGARLWCSEERPGFVAACQAPRPVAPEELFDPSAERCLRFIKRAP